MGLLTLALFHDLLDVALEGLVGRGEEGEAVLLDHLEIIRRVDPALVEDAATRAWRSIHLSITGVLRPAGGETASGGG